MDIWMDGPYTLEGKKDYFKRQNAGSILRETEPHRGGMGKVFLGNENWLGN